MKAVHHHQARRALWQRAREWLNANHALVTAAATVVLAVATIVLALATCSLVRISSNTDVTLHDTLVAANRAWVTPAAAFLVDAPTVGKTVRYRVQYGNSGKEPATGFVAQEDAGIIDAPTPQDTLYTILPKTNSKTFARKLTRRGKEAWCIQPARTTPILQAQTD